MTTHVKKRHFKCFIHILTESYPFAICDILYEKKTELLQRRQLYSHLKVTSFDGINIF